MPCCITLQGTRAIDQTHAPELESWVPSANLPDCEFPIQNLPWGTFRKHGEEQSRPGIAIGDQILDAKSAFGIESVAAVMAQPRITLRQTISEYLSKYQPGADRNLTPMVDAELLLPCAIGDYTDFYASLHHAANVGSMFRPDNPLLPNYKWVPIAYHGRASSVVISGTPVRRPKGQTGQGRFAPTGRLDYEVELGAFIGPGNVQGEPIPIAEAEDHLFGVCLLNDWSARDIQAWEYQPLGPFLAKNFATTISPWIVTLEALEPFRCMPEPRPSGDPDPLEYLAQSGPGAFGIVLEAWLRTAKMSQPVRVSQGNFASMYWTLGQMIAHHTSNGCPLKSGDLIGSGTVSGPEKQNRGCLLEMTWRGTDPLTLPNGETRHFLEDGDEVILRGRCEAPGYRSIGLGSATGGIIE
jgi:fumarylacetoacetase